jgi:hypothetical protein
MRRIKQFGERTANWVLLSNKLKPHLEGMPHLQALHADLEALIAEAQQVDGEHETAKGLSRELTRRKQEVQTRGDSLRARIAAHLRGTFGFTSEQIIQFGLEPLKRRARRRGDGEPQPPATPAPAPTAPVPSSQIPA